MRDKLTVRILQILFIGLFAFLPATSAFGGDKELSAAAENLGFAPTPFDFDGDGKTDIAIYRPSNGQWWVRKSSDGSHFVATFGISTDRIVPADYTGDGKTDIAVWRPSSGEWFILRSEDFSYYAVPFGISTDIPAPADYDGDGKADIAIARLTSWWIRQSTDGVAYAVSFFAMAPSETLFLPGDYTGDGRVEPALYNAINNQVWQYYRYTDGGNTEVGRGISGVPVPGDYDGDHRIDVAMFNSSTGVWTIYKTTGGITNIAWGSSGDLPIPNAFVR